MDSLHLAIATIPLAIYFVVLGAINLSPRPLMTTGARDFLALSLGIAGLVIAGPMELFLPERAAQTFGAYVWVLMIILYLLTCVLIALMGRPRLVIYNLSAAELKPLLEQAAKAVDPQASWADETYVLPQAHVQLHVEPFPALRNISLVAIGSRQSWRHWRHLELALSQQLRSYRGGTNPYGLALIIGGLLLAAGTTVWLANDRQAVAQSLWDMLRL